MTRPPHEKRLAPGHDDLQDDFEDYGLANEVRNERRKQLAFDVAKRWHWIVLGLILGALGGSYYLSKVPRLYRATSTILVKQQASSVMKRDQADDIDLRSADALNTLAERIKRPELLQRVAALPEIRLLPGLVLEPVQWLPGWASSWLGTENDGKQPLSATVPPTEELADRLSSWLGISLRRGTRLLDVSVTHSSPLVAKTVADAIAVEYQAELTGNRSKGHTSSAEIIVKEWQSAGATLQTAQNALANYQGVLATLADLERRKTTAMELSRRYLPKHPRMAAANAELAATQERFLSEFESARSSPADRDHWQVNAKDWADNADDGDRLQTARRLLLARSQILSSEIETRTTVFNGLLTRIQESDINQQAVESEMEISSFARLPRLPSSPNSARLIALSLVAGLAAGGLLALALVLLDTKFHTFDQVEREAKLPVLAVIEDIQMKTLAEAAKKIRITLKPSSECPGRDPRLVFRPGMSDTPFAQTFRGLRTTVSLLGDERKRRVTLFSSALPGEGKTFVSSNFALASAVQGKKTLLIDLDLLKPSVHTVFGVKRDSQLYGATDILAGRADFDDAIFTDTGLDNLHLMLSGNPATNAGELLSTVGLEKLLETAAAQYDLVIVDSAPLLAVPDTRMIAPLVDNFFLVTRAEFVPKAAVRCAISLLAADQRLPHGVIFNGFRPKRRLMGRNYSYCNYAYGNYHYAYGSGNP